MKTKIWAVAVVLLGVLPSCSLLNREGPDVTCADLDNGAVNDCKDGIIATCENGHMKYEVCDTSNTCEEAWQTDKKYRCQESSPVPSLGTGGTGGSGGSSGTGGTGGTGGSAGGTGGSGGCDPTGPCIIVDNGNNGIEAFALGTTNVYFSDGTSIQSAAKTGGFPTVLATGLTSNAWWNMTADEDHVYVRKGTGAIVRVPVGGGALETFAEAANGPFAADAKNIYWVGYSQTAGQGLWLTPKAGGEQVEMAANVSLQSTELLVARDGYVYWASGDTISRVPTSGSFPTSPTSIPVGIPALSFAVGSDALFFAGRTDGVVAKLPIAGGGLIELVTGQSYPNQIALADNFVYWDAGSHTGRAIYKVGVNGGAATELVDLASNNINAVSRMITDGSHVYWADWSMIHRAPK